MAAVKKFLDIVKGGEEEKKKKPSKLHDAFDAFKSWVTSPGGIITILGFVAIVWYIHHKTEDKK